MKNFLFDWFTLWEDGRFVVVGLDEKRTRKKSNKNGLIIKKEAIKYFKIVFICLFERKNENDRKKDTMSNEIFKDFLHKNRSFLLLWPFKTATDEDLISILSLEMCFSSLNQYYEYTFE